MIIQTKPDYVAIKKQFFVRTLARPLLLPVDTRFNKAERRVKIFKFASLPININF